MATLHGGQLSRVAKEYQIPENEWVDLSTGIAPFSYPIPDIPMSIWQNLPTIPSSLIEVASDYYQAQYCWPLSGSQALIEKLPFVWEIKLGHDRENIEKHAYLPKIGYKEHQQAWSNAGYQLHFYQQNLPTEIKENSVVVVINPNNPLTDMFDIDSLMVLHQQCKQVNALFILDEAFADIFPFATSFVPYIKNEDNVIVLRSFGKFFGLAGLRIGFVCANKYWIELIKEMTGPWAVNGPALAICEQALRDNIWQEKQLKRLEVQSKKQYSILANAWPNAEIKYTALFITLFTDQAPEIYKQLCQQGIYVRLCDENNALRFGIGADAQLARLQAALKK